jgi:hypothetical protein
MDRTVPWVEWKCRDCDCDISEAHKPTCRFAPPPELACGGELAHNSHAWPGPEGRVFCPGRRLTEGTPYVVQLCLSCGVVQNEAGDCGYCAARVRADG